MKLIKNRLLLVIFGILIIAQTIQAESRSNEKNAANQVRENSKPNIVFIIGDDISWNDFGCYGHPTIKTPNIDKLASEGIKFNNAYLTASSCSSSRCSIITGRYPHNTGACKLHSHLPEDQVLFPELLIKAGYYTAHAGKWHFGENSAEGYPGPAQRAFETFGGTNIERGPGMELQWVSRLQNRPKNKPFFMWFAAFDAHRGWSADKRNVTNDPADVVVPPFLFDGEKTRRDLASYYNEITRFDYYVGEIVNELDKQGVLDNTIILVLADNGRAFPRCKTRVYDSGMKTPLVIKWSAGIKKSNVTTDAMVSVIDIAPTLFDLAGVTASVTFQGKSFKKILNNPTDEFREYIFSEHNWHAYESYERQVRTKDYMYLINKVTDRYQWGSPDAVRCPAMVELKKAYEAGLLDDNQKILFNLPAAAEELYYCVKDPFQTNNIAGDKNYAKEQKKLSDALKTWQEETGDSYPYLLTQDDRDRKTGKRTVNKNCRRDAGKI